MYELLTFKLDTAKEKASEFGDRCKQNIENNTLEI